MKYLAVLAGVALCFASCNTNKADKTADDQSAETPVEVVNANVEGKWQLAKYTVDGNAVEVASDAEYVIDFVPADSTFSMTTSCNNIGGKYVVNGDSIKFDNLFSTRMMCENMAVEDAMNQILPAVNLVKVDGDSVLTLNNADAVLAQFNKVVAVAEQN